MPDDMVTRAASGRQRSLAAFFAATFLGLALFFLIVGLSGQDSAMLAASGALALAGLALLLVVLRLRKKLAGSDGLAEPEDLAVDSGEADEIDDDDLQETVDQADPDALADTETEMISQPERSGQLPEPRPGSEERLFEHKTDDLRDSVNYRR